MIKVSVVYSYHPTWKVKTLKQVRSGLPVLFQIVAGGQVDNLYYPPNSLRSAVCCIYTSIYRHTTNLPCVTYLYLKSFVSNVFKDYDNEHFMWLQSRITKLLCWSVLLSTVYCKTRFFVNFVFIEPNQWNQTSYVRSYVNKPYGRADKNNYCSTVRNFLAILIIDTLHIK